MLVSNFIKGFSETFIGQKISPPWDITKDLQEILFALISDLDDSYTIRDGVAIHKTAIVEQGAILKAPIIIRENCFVGAHAYLRGGVFLGNNTTVGPSSEIKSSIIFGNSVIAHFNFIGDSIIGNNVNFESGSVTANCFNEREDKSISVVYKENIINTKAEKFGSLVGDNCKIGANAVLSPGTILEPHTIVQRLELVDQMN